MGSFSQYTELALTQPLTANMSQTCLSPASAKPCQRMAHRVWQQQLAPALLMLSAAGLTVAEEQATFGPVTWQVLWHNDGFANSDDQFTNGVSVRQHSALADSLDATDGTLGIGKSLARRILPSDSNLHYRETTAFGQNLQTPDDIIRNDVILNDVPYVGMVGWSSNYVAFDDRRLRGFGLMIGFVGKPALGEPLQSAAHRLTGANDPKGWDNQLDFEPLLNLHLTHKRKLWSLPGFSGALSIDAALGNFFTLGQAGFEATLGDAPSGFLFQPVPIGRGLDFDATLREPGRTYTYASVTARVTGIGFALPREGNLLRNGNEWTDDNIIDPERRVYQLVLGLHHERPRWGLHFSFWLSSDTIKGEGKGPVAGSQNSFGTITLDWRPRSRL